MAFPVQPSCAACCTMKLGAATFVHLSVASTSIKNADLNSRTMPETQPCANPYVTMNQYTRVHNSIFDRIMPTLSGNGLKILLVVLRQTWGYADSSSASGRRQFDRISYSQFIAQSGIRSTATIRRAVQECLDAGCLVRQRVGIDSRSGQPLYAYALNTDLAVDSSEVKNAGALETETPSTSETEAPSALETEVTKGKEKNKIGGDTAHILSLLKSFGMALDPEVHALADRYSLPQVEHAIERAREQARSNPPGLLRCWMRSGHMPFPASKEQNHAPHNRDHPGLNDDARAFAAIRAARTAERGEQQAPRARTSSGSRV